MHSDIYNNPNQISYILKKLAYTNSVFSIRVTESNLIFLFLFSQRKKLFANSENLASLKLVKLFLATRIKYTELKT
jgi:hypothetical protein